VNITNFFKSITCKVNKIFNIETQKKENKVQSAKKETANVFPTTNEDNLCELSETQEENGKTWVDDVYNSINSSTPDIAYEKAPKSFSLQTESAYDFTNDNELAFDKLPRTKDGKIDTAKVKESLKKSTKLITDQNKQAEEMMDYGIYREAINNSSLLVAMLGPEVANLVTSLGGDKIPDWAKEGVSLFDLDLNSILKILEEAGLDAEEYGINDIVDFTDIKTNDEIMANIKAQEKGLSELENFEINNDEDAKEFLEKYSELTGTSFFCDEIDKCDKLYKDKKSSEKDKLKAYQKACGSSKNLTDAQKNNIMTDVCYNVGFRYLIPVAINKIDSIPTKIISTALPTYIELAETSTKNKEDDEIVNLRNLDYKTLITILSEGAVEGLFVNLSGSINYGKGLKNKVTGKAKTGGIKTVLNWISKAGVKSVTPNYSSWGKAALTTFIPGSGAFFDW